MFKSTDGDLDLERPEMLWKILSAIHFRKHPQADDFPSLKCYLNDEMRRNYSILIVLKGGKIGEFKAKILHASCILCGLELSAELFARFIFFADNITELKNFVSFAITLTPFFPNVMTLAIKNLLLSIKQFEKEPFAIFRDQDLNVTQLSNTRFITNLMTLLEWQNIATENDELKYLGINLVDLKGDFLEDLMAWGLTFIERVGRQRCLNEENAVLIDNFLTLMRIVQPQVQLRLRHPNRLLVQFCGLIIALLKLVDKENFGTLLDGVDFVCRFFVVTGVFFSVQVGASKSLLISSLVDEAFENSASLFGTLKNESRMRADTINYDPLLFGSLLSSHIKLEQEFPSLSNSEYSCLRELRSSQFGLRNAAAMAHSGVFSKRHCKFKQTSIGESEALRILLFVNLIDNLCMDDGTYNLDTCKFLGEALVKRFCLDGLTLSISWSDWKLEKEFVSKYIEITKRLDYVPFVNDFLLILSEVGLSGVFYALPIIKCQFALVLVNLESTPLKDSKINSQNILKIAQIFSVFIGAKFIPKILEIVFEIICQITNHEAYTIFLHFWGLIQLIVPEDKEHIPLTNESILSNEMLLLTGPGNTFISTIIIVIQRNIFNLGIFLPKIIEETGIAGTKNEVAEDDWS